jgi:hypothetical protein
MTHQAVLFLIVAAVLLWLFTRTRFDTPGAVQRTYWRPRYTYDGAWGGLIVLIIVLLLLGVI